LRAVIQTSQVLGGNQVDEHVFGGKHDDFPQGEHHHRQHPQRQAGGQAEPGDAQQEQAQPQRQPAAQVTLGNPPANRVLQADHQQRIGRHQGADDAVSGLGRQGDHQVLREIGRELAKDHRAEQAAQGEAHQAVVP